MILFYLIFTGLVGILYIVYKIVIGFISLSRLKKFDYAVNSLFDSLQPNEKMFDIDSIMYISKKRYSINQIMKDDNFSENVMKFIKDFRVMQSSSEKTIPSIDRISYSKNFKNLLFDTQYKESELITEILKNFGKLFIPFYWYFNFAAFVLNSLKSETDLEIPQASSDILKFIIGLIIPLATFIFEYGKNIIQ